MAQKRLDHVMVAIFDSSDERSHTVLVFRRNEKEERGCMFDRMEGTMREMRGQKFRKGDAPFSSMSRGEAWGRSWFTLLRSPSEHAWNRSAESIILKERE
jgi:hypothetical protein